MNGSFICRTGPAVAYLCQLRRCGAGCKGMGLRPPVPPAEFLSCSEDDTGLMLHFFGENGQKKLDLAAFNAFLEGLHAEIDRLEFQHYDPQGTVCFPRPAEQDHCDRT